MKLQLAAFLAGAALVTSISFFLISNFAVWAVGGMYPKTLPGLAACYVAGLARDIREGIGLAVDAIDRGAAGDVLQRFIAASHRVAAAEGAPA